MKLHVEFDLGDSHAQHVKDLLEKLKTMRPHTINVTARKDGREVVFEGDFLKTADYIELI